MAREQRRLAAIVSADVAGYSRLMGRDESGTLAALKAIRAEVVDPRIAAHGGRIVKTTGDGLLLEFASVVDAVRCALDVQDAMAGRGGEVAFRVGVNLGDIIIDGDDIFGDGVNIAARLEGIAEPGGICVSDDAWRQVRGKIDVVADDLGPQALKNIAQPVRAWRLKLAGAFSSLPSPTGAGSGGGLALPDKPSIAVLPFQNMSGDPEQEYFADGLVEDVITELSRFRSLFVIARNSSFSYKGKSPDIRQVGRELGVRFVLEGGLRKAGDRVRLTAQLVEAATGSHRWAERYDRRLEDVFEVQEELTRRIVTAIAPELEGVPISAASRPADIGAYELAVRARSKLLALAQRPDALAVDGVIGDARAALAIDPRSTIALNMIAYAQWHHLLHGTTQNLERAWREGLDAATRSIELDRLDSSAHNFKGVLLVYAPGRDRIDEALLYLRRAHELNPNDMLTLAGLALGEIVGGQSADALAHVTQAMRLSPRDPLSYTLCLLAGMASLALGQYADGVRWLQRGIHERAGHPALHAHLAMSLIGLGDLDAARTAFAEARRLGPAFIERGLAGGLRYHDATDLRRATTLLRIAAGLEDPAAAEAFR